jgi:hypothetical protein
MPSSSNGSGQYCLDFSEEVGAELTYLQRRATRRGQAKAFASSFRRIRRALRKDPNQVGEPLYRLPALRLQVRLVVVAPLVIEFAVSNEHRIVYIKSCQLLFRP